MSEVAPTVFQCGYCGAGPNAGGHYPTWCLFNVEEMGDRCAATCIEVRGSDYQIYGMEWMTGKGGKRYGDLITDTPTPLPLKGSSEFPLPVIVLTKNPGGLLPGVLSDGMFTETDGPKEVVR